MYEMQFVATTSAGWTQAISLIDATTDLPLDAAGARFDLQIRDENWPVVTLSTIDGSIARPNASTIQWQVAPERFRSLRSGQTYDVGCTLTTEGGASQLFIGTLALIDGDVR